MGALHKLTEKLLPAKPQSVRAVEVPAKVYVEREGGLPVYSEQPPPRMDARIGELLDGFYGAQNYLQLFFALPEIYAPVHEIASRVADAQWELMRAYGTGDRVIYNDETFNKLFSQPNPLANIVQHVYQAVCYEILTGRSLQYINAPDFFEYEFERTVTWTNLPPSTTPIMRKGVDPYSATSLNDFVDRYELRKADGTVRRFESNRVMGIWNLDLQTGYDVRRVRSGLAGAEKAIRNLIPVYEARGVIYIKRGALGFIVNRGKDANGAFPLTENQRKELEALHTAEHGLQAGQQPFKYTEADIDFVRTAMSIKELEPFEETKADALAIYTTLRVPRHLAPTAERSNYDNGNVDMRSFYEDVIIPWATKYANLWTEGFGLRQQRRFIRPNYSHVSYMQENKKDKALVDKTNGEVWLQRWQNGVCSLNEWITANDGVRGDGELYDKKIFELTPEQLEQVAQVIKTLKGSNNETQPTPEGAGSQTQGGGNQLQVA